MCIAGSRRGIWRVREHVTEKPSAERPFAICTLVLIDKAKDNNDGTKPKGHTKDYKPRTIDVLVWETEEKRHERGEAKARREAAMKRVCECFLCKSTSHRVNDCNLLLADVDMQMDIFRKSAESMPCWRCGELGHYKKDCPSVQTAGKPSLVRPPQLSLDVSSVLDSDRPFETYCELLSTALDRSNVRIEENNLVNNKRSGSKRQHTDSNWNSERKSTLIIGT